MEISAALAADLADLTTALEQPGTDLESVLRAFGADAHSAVRSYLGLTMTIFTESLPFSFTVLEPLAREHAALASLLVPLPSLLPAEAGSHLVLYASKAGAFTDLSADLGFALDVGLATLVLDQHLSPPHDDAATGLLELSSVNQAIGILIGRGRTPEDARVELDRLASDAGGVVVAAQELIASLPLPPAVEPG